MHMTRKTNTFLSMLHPTTLTFDEGYHTTCVAVLNVCLEHKMPVNYKPYYYDTVLNLAVYYQRRKHVQLLIKHRADVNCCSGYPIRHAAWNNDLDVTDMLIDAGADVNLCSTRTSAINTALVYASLPVVSRLIQAGAIINNIMLAMSLARKSAIDSAEKVAFLNTRWNHRLIPSRRAS